MIGNRLFVAGFRRRAHTFLSVEQVLTDQDRSPNSPGYVSVESTAVLRDSGSPVLVAPEVMVYWQIPEEGDPYLVIEIDRPDVPPGNVVPADYRVYLNDSEIDLP